MPERGHEERHGEGAWYERHMGRWSRVTGLPFIQWLSCPKGQEWLDVGCGTGAFTEVILSQCAPARVFGIDPAPDQIAYAVDKFDDDRVAFAVGDATKLDFPDDAFDAATAALVLNFVSDRARAAAEMARVVRPRGTVAAYIWDSAGGRTVTQPLWEAIAAVAPASKGRRAGRPRGADIESLSEVWQGAGLEDVETHAIEIEAAFDDFDDYWDSNIMGSRVGLRYRDLDPDDRTRVRAKLKESLAVSEDGRIPVPARAWAVRGRVPAAGS